MSSVNVKIAIAGIGTVGGGLLELIRKYKSSDIKINITAVASRRKQKFHGQFLKNTLFFKDAKELLSFDDYDILVELIGGDGGVAQTIVFDALKKKKNVVTANKALVAKFWKELKSLEYKNKCVLKYEAAVAGGIPIIKVIEEFLLSNKIKRIYGILNGTSNYILSKMLSSNKEFKSILIDAQKLGYAESDPKFDIDGTDTAQKLSILSSLAFSFNNSANSIKNEGIDKIKLVDLKIAESLGYKIKLLGITEIDKKRIKNYVYPCLLSKDSFVAEVDDVYNGIVVESDYCKKSFFVGEGAGAYPTATSVLSDIVNLSKGKENNLSIYSQLKKYECVTLEDRYGSFYLRFTTDDRSGVISGIAEQFKKYNISMKSMLQKEQTGNYTNNATIVITTHNCFERDMMKALKRINNLNFIREKTVYIRIEKFK